MKPYRPALFILLVLLVGCGSMTPAAQPAAEPSSPLLSQPTSVPTIAATAAPPTLTAVPLPTAAATTAEATSTPQPTAQPTEVMAVEPTDTAEPALFGRTEEGAFFRGAADAPVTLIDYSDFL